MRKHWNTLSVPFLLLVFFAVLVPASRAQQVAKDRIVQAIEGSKVSPLAGTSHPLARAENDQGPVAATMQLQGMSLTFKPSAAQQAALDALLKAQQNPSSSSYHQWLTQAQFADQFGMTQADIDKVTAWLQSQGFTVDGVADSRNSIRFSGSVTSAEQAFHTQIHKYLVNGETHFANTTEVSLPAAFAATVSRVGGLDDFKPKPRYVRPSTSRSAHPQFTDGYTQNHWIAPGDFAVIYDVNPLYTANFTGTGQTIGIAGQTDIVMADITAFRTAAGLPANNPTVFLIPGSADPGIGDASGDINEADLDLEWSGAVAKNATIVFVNSTDALGSLQYAIANKINGVQIPILSVSYGGCEPSFTPAQISSLEASFQQANAQGQTVLAAAGDNGAADCDEQTNPNLPPITAATQGLQVDYPGSSAYVTAMGGSEFMGDGTAANPSTGSDQYWTANGSTTVLTSAKSYIPEMAWNDTEFDISQGGGLSAGGGGKSTLFPKPSWQTGVPGIPSDSARDVPDLSLSASADHDPYLVCTQITLDSNQSNYVSSCMNGFFISDPGSPDNNTPTAFGGTSVAAPSFAGVLALFEQKLGVPQGLGNINPTLYKLASTATTYASAFHDITTGNNIVPCASGSTNCPTSGTLQIGYSAATGYDQATGLGSVDSSNLATAFTTVAVKGGTTTSIAVSPASPVVGVKVTLTATVTPSSGTTAPTGTVTFTIDGTAVTPASTVTNGTAVTTYTFATGGTHTIVASYSGDSNFYISTSATTSITVAASGVAATTTTLVASPTNLALYGALSLTATVQSTAGGTVAGTVTFTIGTTTVGTANVVPGASGVGTATLAVSSATPALGFTAGTDTITASYGGDSTYSASSGTATVTVTNPTITLAATNVTISSPNPGNSGTSTITVTSAGGYSGTVNLSATTSTLNADGSFSATSVAVSPSTPGTATLTIETTTATGSIRKSPSANLRQTAAKVAVAGGTAAGCILLLLVPGIRRRRWPAAMVMLVFLGVSAGLGCGGGGSGGASPAGTYTVSVTGTDSSNANITATTTFTVTIN